MPLLMNMACFLLLCSDYPGRKKRILQLVSLVICISSAMKSLAVTRVEQGMVRACEEAPSGVTPLELSAIDQLPNLRRKVQSLQVYPPGGGGSGPAKVIKAGLAKALVHYYPFAGRLQVHPADPAMVQLSPTGEGVWFVEASANCTLRSLNFLDADPSHFSSELLPGPPPAGCGFDPVLHMQVTEFECRGFVLAMEMSHTICDGLGAGQFLNAIGELARGLDRPSVEPVWMREIMPLPPKCLSTPAPPPHPSSVPPMPTFSLKEVVVDVSREKVAQMKRDFFDLTGRTCSSFEAVTASLWQSRTRAIELDSKARVTLVFFANIRNVVQPPLPQGYYGNCFFPVTVAAESKAVAWGSYAEVVKMIQEAKARLPAQFGKWTVGEWEEGDPFTPEIGYATLFVSEWGRLGFASIDFGWGPPMHLIPIPYSSAIPACIIGSPPAPQKGLRLITWCVQEDHLQEFHHQMDMAAIISEKEEQMETNAFEHASL